MRTSFSRALLAVALAVLASAGAALAVAPRAALAELPPCDGSATCCTETACCSADAGHCPSDKICSCSSACGDGIGACSCTCKSENSVGFGEVSPTAAETDSLTVQITRPGGVPFREAIDFVGAQTGWSYSVPEPGSDVLLVGPFRGTVGEVHRALAEEAGFELAVDAVNRSATFLRRR
jgi:hypothetical protein